MVPSETAVNEYIDTDEPLLTFETFEMIDNEILSEVANPGDEKEELFEEDNVIIDRQVKHEVMRAFLQTCAFYDADNGDEMREMRLKVLAAVVLVCSEFALKNVHISEGWSKQTHKIVFVKNTSRKKFSHSLTNSCCIELFSGSYQSSFYRESSVFLSPLGLQREDSHFQYIRFLKPGINCALCSPLLGPDNVFIGSKYRCLSHPPNMYIHKTSDILFG